MCSSGSSPLSLLNSLFHRYGNSLLTESSFPLDSSDTTQPVIKRQPVAGYACSSSPRPPLPISIDSNSSTWRKSMVGAPLDAPMNQQLPSLTKKNCRKCMQPLRGPRVSVPTLTGDIWYYHYDCLTCTGCGDVFTDSEFVGDGENVFHMHCSPSPPLSPTSTTSSSDSMPPSTMKEEDTYKRTRCIPPLGGSKICPGCNASISVMEETPGPRASRWHKRCLKCAGCKKQMDSGTKVVLEQQGRWFVRCTDCSVSSKRRRHESMYLFFYSLLL